jgi:hypothetical protein
MKLKIALAASLICAVSVQCLAADAPPHQVKDWVFEPMSGGGAIARTNNDSGSVLGIVCLKYQDCYVYFSAGSTCEPGSKYPMLLNSDEGAMPVTGTCTDISAASNKRQFVQSLDPFDKITAAMLHNHWMGVAVPMANGQFKVSRFSLEGSNETFAEVSKALPATAGTPGEKRPVKANADEVL